MRWDEALAGLAAKLEHLERALDSDDWESLDLEPFAAPEVSGDMTPQQRERAAGLMRRLARTQERIAHTMAGVQRELSDLEARRRGARSYASSDSG